MLVELKNGDTYNGHLVNCDTWMNINLRDVICTSRVRCSNCCGMLCFVCFAVLWELCILCVMSIPNDVKGDMDILFYVVCETGWRQVLEDSRDLYSREHCKISANS